MKITTIAILLLIYFNSIAQDYNGLYLSLASDTLKIYDDSLVQFNFDHGCCIYSTYYGFGKLSNFEKNQIVITEDSELYQSSYFHVIEKLPDTNIVEIMVKNNQNSPLISVAIEAIDEKERPTYGVISNKSYSILEVKDDITKLSIDYFDYNGLEIPIESVKGKRVDCFLQTGFELTNDILKLTFIDTNTVVLVGIYNKESWKKQYKCISSDLRMIYRTWPWHWRWWYKTKDNSIPIEFVKQ